MCIGIAGNLLHSLYGVMLTGAVAIGRLSHSGQSSVASSSPGAHTHGGKSSTASSLVSPVTCRSMSPMVLPNTFERERGSTVRQVPPYIPDEYVHAEGHIVVVLEGQRLIRAVTTALGQEWQTQNVVAKPKRRSPGSWFIKWQGLGAADKSKDISFSEATARATAEIYDEVDAFETWEDFHDRKIMLPGATLGSVLSDWTSIIDSQRANCLWARDQ